MIANMNRDQFDVELKELICVSDLHKRYYTIRSRQYCRVDYWMKCILGMIGAFGAIIAANDNYRIIGVLMAGGCAFVIGTVLPNFKWDAIVDGLKGEQEEWTRIYQGFEALQRMAVMLNKDEILTLKFEEVSAVKRAAALNDRYLPEDDKLFKKIIGEVRDYWGLPPEEKKLDEPKTQPENN